MKWKERIVRVFNICFSLFQNTTSDPFSLPVKNTTSSLELTSYSDETQGSGGSGGDGEGVFLRLNEFSF